MELDTVRLKEIKPVLAGYIKEAQFLLRISAFPDEKVVHDVRVLMKKTRAVMKLAGPQLDKEFFIRDSIVFREVGRIMCSWREISVLRKLLKELKKKYPGIFFRLADYEKLAALLKKPEPGYEPSEDSKNGLQEIMVLLNKAGYRLRFQTMNNLDPQILLKELEITYLRVVDTYLTCRNSLKKEDLHEFRKKAKDFLYQLYFFRPLNTTVVKALEKKLDDLTQYLGRYNDLACLINALEYKYDHTSNLAALDELIVKIREEQDKYLADVWPIAYKVFCPGQKLVNVLGFRLLII
jgi:CHAD domain-containing protein